MAVFVGCRDTRTVSDGRIALHCFFVSRPSLTVDLSVIATHALSLTAVNVGRQK